MESRLVLHPNVFWAYHFFNVSVDGSAAPKVVPLWGLKAQKHHMFDIFGEAYLWLLKSFLFFKHFYTMLFIHRKNIEKTFLGARPVQTVSKHVWMWHYGLKLRLGVNNFLETIYFVIIFKYLDMSKKGLSIIYQNYLHNPAKIDFSNVNNINTGKRREICSKLTIKTPEWCQWLTYFQPYSGVSIVEQVNVSWVKTFGLLTANQGKLLGWPLTGKLLGELINYYPPWNHQKTYDFLMISEGIELNSVNPFMTGAVII